MKHDPDIPECNVAAAAKVFDDYGDFIEKTIRSKIQDQNHAEDLYQNFFLCLVHNPLSGDIQNIEAYLYKVISNLIIDATRTTNAYQNCINKYAEHYRYPPSRTNPEKDALEMDETKKLFNIIGKQLSRTEAQAVRMRYQDGLSTERIAEKMGVQRATVRGYVSEGLRKIRELLKDISVGTVE